VLSDIQSRLDELKKLPQIKVIGDALNFEIQISIQDMTGWFSPILMSVCAYGFVFLKNSEHAINPFLLWVAPILPILVAYLWMLWDRGTTHHIYFEGDAISYARKRRNKTVESCKGFVNKVNVYFYNTRGPGGLYKIYLTEELGNYFVLPDENLLDLFQDLEKQNQANGTVALPVTPNLSPTNVFKLILIGMGIFAALFAFIILWSKLTT